MEPHHLIIWSYFPVWRPVNIYKVGHGIIRFNVQVKTLIQSPLARGDMSTDLLGNLFKGYNMSSDQEFIKYIKTKEDNDEEG